jgi:uncharacterized protein DUF4333
MRRALAVPLLGVMLAPAFVGRAGAAVLKPTAVREEIGRQVAATYPGVTFGNVACPDGVPRRQGVKFTCTVQLPGTFLFVDATESDGRGGVTFETTRAVLTKQALEAFVAANASLPSTVVCGTTPLLVVRPGDVLSCHASIADGAQRDVQLTVRDTAGNVTITAVT